MSSNIPGVIVQHTPEAEFCCGSLCDKSRLITQISSQIERALLLEHALRELNPQHPLLRETHGPSNRK